MKAISGTLVSTEQLATLASDPTCVIVDCRYDLTDPDWGVEQYRQGHVPGAVYASLSHDLAGAAGSGGGRHPLPSPDAVAATFGRFGITSRSQVVCYDQDVGMFAARLWWMLRYMGHEAVAVVDGGFAKWISEGRPVRSGIESREAAQFIGSVRPAMRRTLDQVAARLGDATELLIDARAPERFDGRSEPLDRAAGHIPGAVNYHYRRSVAEDGTMLPVETLRAQLSEALGATSPEHTTVYCGSGVTACHNLLAMEHAGLRGAALFPGSWSEWSSDPSRPVETQ